MLAPAPEQHGIAIALAAIGVLGLTRAVGNARVLFKSAHHVAMAPTVRRLGWTVAADIVLLIVAATFYANGDSRATVFLMGAVFVLLIGSADVAWSILNLVSRDPPVRG